MTADCRPMTDNKVELIVNCQWSIDKRTMDFSYFGMSMYKRMLEFGVSELGIPSSFGFRYSDFSTERG